MRGNTPERHRTMVEQKVRHPCYWIGQLNIINMSV